MTECYSLKDKMQYQRETAAASLNRIQKQNQEKCTELHSKIQELNENVKEVRGVNYRGHKFSMVRKKGGSHCTVFILGM